MPIDHDYIRVAADGSGKRVANVKQTDPDAAEVYLQKTVTWDPEDETDAGGMGVTDGRAQVDAAQSGTWAVTANAGTNLNTSALATSSKQDAEAVLVGAVNETAPGTDTASSGLNGRLQRIAQRLTSLIALLPAALGSGGGLKVDGSGTALPVSGTFWQATQPVSVADAADVTIGAKADAKSAATDTTAITAMSVWKQISASVQAIATSVSGTLTVASHAVTNAGTFAVQATEADGASATLGAQADAKSTATDTTAITAMSVWKQISASVQAIASSVAGTLTVGTHAVTQSGTWTVQPGNTANTTAWKVDGSAATQPVSGTVTANAGTDLNTSLLATASKQDAEAVLVGAVNEAAPGTDTASSGLNGRLQRIAQRLTSIIALLPTALGSGGGLKVDGSGTALPVSGTVTINAIPAGSNNIGDVDVLTVPADPFGATADAAVTAGATGSISAKLRSISRDLVANIVLAAGSAIIGKVGIDQTTPGTTNLVAAGQNGTWNITNVSGTVSLPTGAATLAKQPALGTAGASSADVISVQGVASGTVLPVGGTIAHDGIDSGNPQKIGGKAKKTARAAVADDDRVDGWWSQIGSLAIFADWRMNATPKKYMITCVLTPGAATANTNLMGVRKQNANADCYISRIVCHVYHAAAGVATPVGWKRATTVAGGSAVTAADIPKLDSAAADASLEVRTGAVTVGAEANQYMLTHEAPVAAAPAQFAGSGFRSEWIAWDRSEMIRLTADEGLILELQAAGDTDNRYHVTLVWEEA